MADPNDTVLDRRSLAYHRVCDLVNSTSISPCWERRSDGIGSRRDNLRRLVDCSKLFVAIGSVKLPQLAIHGQPFV